MRPIVAGGVAWSVGLSVGLTRSWTLQKRLKWSRCRLGCGLGPREPYIKRGSRSRRVKGQLCGQKAASLRHARTCPTVDILKVTQQEAAPLWCRCRLGVLDGDARWHNLVNAMEACVCHSDAALC